MKLARWIISILLLLAAIGIALALTVAVGVSHQPTAVDYLSYLAWPATMLIAAFLVAPISDRFLQIGFWRPVLVVAILAWGPAVYFVGESATPKEWSSGDRTLAYGNTRFDVLFECYNVSIARHVMPGADLNAAPIRLTIGQASVSLDPNPNSSSERNAVFVLPPEGLLLIREAESDDTVAFISNDHAYEAVVGPNQQMFREFSRACAP